MKKTLLLAAGLMLAGSAMAQVSEPTLTSVWQYTTNIPGSPSGGDFRFAAVSNGKLIVNDKANKKIVEITENGAVDYYDLTPAITANYSETSLGPAIANDDAGNILVSTGWSGATSGAHFTLISADLKSYYKIDLSTIEGYTAPRTDQLGRIVGNMLSNEGAYLFISSGGSKVLVAKIANGAIVSGETINASNLSTSTLAQSKFNTVAEIDALADKSTSFVMRNRSYPSDVYFWTEGSAEMDKIQLTKKTSEGYTTSNASTEGFAYINLQGEGYFLMPLTTDGTTANRSTAFAIYNEAGNIVAYNADNLKTHSSQIFGSFIVVPNNETSVYIYRFAAGLIAQKFLFEVPADPTAIEVIEAENAPVEYYNLQGVKVENPSNGLFIKKQGSKTTKVVL